MPESYFCISGRATTIEVDWPVESAVYNGILKSWMRIKVVDLETGKVAKCGVPAGRGFAEFGLTPFDRLERAVNRIRAAVDSGLISFYDERDHPTTYQNVSESDDQPIGTADAEALSLQKFLAGKAYFLGFRAKSSPRLVPIADPWDASYLDATCDDLMREGHVLAAKDLVEVNASVHGTMSPAKKLVGEGWPDAIGQSSRIPRENPTTFRTLPSKEMLVTDLRAAAERPAGVSVIVLDLDHFKEVNDTKGHSEGDACLDRVVKAIVAALGSKGTLYRWGGDEFAILLPDFSSSEALVTAERIRIGIEGSRAGSEVRVTASIGIADRAAMAHYSPEALIDAADKAMYSSKKSGKNRRSVFVAEDDESRQRSASN
jgi:diguanylate cyclase (GGDEF)-like protein